MYESQTKLNDYENKRKTMDAYRSCCRNRCRRLLFFSEKQASSKQIEGYNEPENQVKTFGIQPNQTVPTGNTNTTTAAVNPPHGQPGHRCDIPVGSPLNGQPSSTTTTPAQIQTQVPQNTGNVAPGTNPPHGQPGHRCDIPVGSPL